MYKLTLLFILFSSFLSAQTITGKLYDEESAISGAKIMNMSLKSITSSNAQGDFVIPAHLGDTLIFSSPFHHTQSIVVTENHFEELQVFELKKIVNELDQVDLSSRHKNLNIEKKNKDVQNQFANDLKRNPHLYKRPKQNPGGIDIKEIVTRIYKLFKGNKKSSPAEEFPVSSSDLNHLFNQDQVLNDKFLVLDLNITKDYKYLFFAFCETKQIPSNLLTTSNRIYLVDKLLEYSNEFREILSENQTAE